ALNHFSSSQFTLITADIESFAPGRKYDLILANPPFVPTPNGIEGTLTSNGGPEGSRLVEILVERLEEFLDPDGRALVYVFQFAKDPGPLIIERLARTSTRRRVELTPAQEKPIPFETFCNAYRRIFPEARAVIERWRSDLLRMHGSGLVLCH